MHRFVILSTFTLALAQDEAYLSCKTSSGVCDERQVERLEEELLEESQVALLQLQLTHQHADGKANGTVDSNSSVVSKSKKSSDPAKDLAFAWDQVKAAVHIDEINEKLKELGNSASTDVRDEVNQLNGELKTLKAEAPDAEQIKDRLRGSWEQIRQAVSAENLKEKVEEAKKAGDSSWQRLQSEYEKAAQSVHIDQVKEQIAGQWHSIADGLPNMDQIRKSWDDTFGGDLQKAAGDAQKAASDAWDKVSHWFR
eukprot:TRINITY_DN2405_c0_g2_i1.p1 TRINITY_DN2405_c0_g2~~TRINITY_DN2405_c0_g2_i1.p1  ORF type:complete len:254 (-),score=66.55 TRINITY_DN2405_c0_g2_i1:127-888(-)